MDSPRWYLTNANVVEPAHWSEFGRGTLPAKTGTRSRPHRSVRSFGDSAAVRTTTQHRMNKKTSALLAALVLIVVWLTGCGKKADAPGNPPPSKVGQDATSATKSALETVLVLWLKGD